MCYFVDFQKCKYTKLNIFIAICCKLAVWICMKTIIHARKAWPWHSSFKFAHAFFSFIFQADREGPDDTDANRCIIHYVIVDVWDKDTLNLDDFMGRVMIPVSFLSQETFSGWFSLGRTNGRDAHFTGEIYLELTIQSSAVRNNTSYTILTRIA